MKKITLFAVATGIILTAAAFTLTSKPSIIVPEIAAQDKMRIIVPEIALNNKEEKIIVPEIALNNKIAPNIIVPEIA